MTRGPGYGEPISPLLRRNGHGRLGFWCPGCDSSHYINVSGGPKPTWGWNGSVDAPTFTPSISLRTGHYVGGGQPGGCWCDYEDRLGRPLPSGCGCIVCHSFVTDGRIQFLADCTHALAGQTVPIPPFDGEEA